MELTEKDCEIIIKHYQEKLKKLQEAREMAANSGLEAYTQKDIDAIMSDGGGSTC